MSGSRQISGRPCVIFNPTAKGEGARRALQKLQALKSGCGLKPTLAAGAARTLAAEAVREGYDTLVAMGGDGTVNEVLNGIADEPHGFARVRLAVLPVGTVNVFARELGIPFQFTRAWELICQGHEQTIDLPHVSYQTPRGTERRWFAQMAGCGLDARAVELLDWKLKKRIGQFAYLASGLRALQETKPLLRVVGGPAEMTGELVLLGNGRLYGGPIPLFERADLQDGLLDVCVFPKITWHVILRYACAYVSPKLLRRGSEIHFQAPAVTIQSSGMSPLEIDGEHIGHAPATFQMERGVVRVLAPGNGTS